jgi:hypothetical protein
LSFIMGVTMSLKKMVNPVWLGNDQEEQKQRG